MSDSSRSAPEKVEKTKLAQRSLTKTSDNSVKRKFQEHAFSTRVGTLGGGRAATRIPASPHACAQMVWRRRLRGGGRVGPLELELDLFLVPLPLVLYVELRSGWHVDPLPGYLDLEPLARLQRIGEPPKLRHELRGGSRP